VFTLEVARTHVRDLQLEAERAHRRHDARRSPGTPLRRLVRRALGAR
jgi:hypothetical protein